MATQKDFYERALLERAYLKLIFDKLPTTYDYKTWMTPAEGREVYDGLLFIFEKGTSNLIDRFLIEVKVRDRFYPELIFEKNKYDDLRKERTRIDKKTNKECYIDIRSRIVYINVTPQGTYWFDIDKLESEFEWVNEIHWASTTDKSKGKINKILTKIDCKKGKLYPVKTGDYINPKATEIMMINHKRTKQIGIVF
jgi:hypothetical protein